MSQPHDVPERCMRCGKFHEPDTTAHCNHCRRFMYNEQILCHLNREAQPSGDFHCQAFRPMLKLVGPDEGRSAGPAPEPAGNGDSPRGPELDQDKLQYVKQLALEHRRYMNETLFSDLKYHLMWNVTHRMDVFTIDPDTFNLVWGAFHDFGRDAGFFTDMSYLASDHVHVYLSFDGSKSVETVVEKMKRYTERKILGKYTYIRKRLGPDADLWDSAFLCKVAG